jgi:DNA-binding transcriptional MerR regulator
MKWWTIGQLARGTGVTVRTLHHYDAIGLLRPARREGSRYRQYSEEDVRRLQQIVSLRDVGLGLDEIRAYLERPESSLLEVIEMQIDRLRVRLAATQALTRRLERLAAAIRAAPEVSADEFIRTMEMMTMFEKYYTAEQLKELEERARVVGPERIKQVEAEWPSLMEEVRLEMERGTDPKDPRVQALARRWQGLIDEFTGGNAGIAASLNRMYAAESTVAGLEVSPMREMGSYIQRSLASIQE